MREPILTIKNLSYKYAKDDVLKNINLLIEKGSVYGLIGPNGAGKTTLIKSILGLLKPQIGKIKCLGKYYDDSRKEILKNIGACIENPSLYAHLTGYDNLKIYSIYHATSNQRIEEMLSLVGLCGDKDKKVKKYSMGMKQKLVLAISLLHNPDFLVLDEPTNGLDPNANLEIIMLLKKLNQKYKKTILVSSHKLNDLEKICTHLGMLKDNHLIYSDVFNKHNEKNFSLESFYFQTYNDKEI